MSSLVVVIFIILFVMALFGWINERDEKERQRIQNNRSKLEKERKEQLNYHNELKHLVSKLNGDLLKNNFASLKTDVGRIINLDQKVKNREIGFSDEIEFSILIDQIYRIKGYDPFLRIQRFLEVKKNEQYVLYFAKVYEHLNYLHEARILFRSLEKNNPPQNYLSLDSTRIEFLILNKNKTLHDFAHKSTFTLENGKVLEVHSLYDYYPKFVRELSYFADDDSNNSFVYNFKKGRSEEIQSQLLDAFKINGFFETAY